MAEKIKQQSRRDALKERLHGRYPELDIEDDEALSGQISDDYDALDARNAEREAFNKRLEEYPENAALLVGLSTGKNADGSDFDLGAYLLEEAPELVEDLIEGNPVNMARYEEGKESRRLAKAEDEKLQAEADALVATEDGALEEAAKEAGYKLGEIKELVDWIYNTESGLLRRAARFELTKDDFLRLFKLKDYDKRLAEAEDKGYVRGRNEKIDMTAHRRSRGERVPVLENGGGRPEEKEEDPYLDNLSRMSSAFNL
jgi:hypothetical protein